MIAAQRAIDLRRLDIEATGEVFHSDIWLRVEDTEVVGELCQALTAVRGVDRATRIQ